MSASDVPVKITDDVVEGTKTRRLKCQAPGCDWMETAGSVSVATRKKNVHKAEHAAAIEGPPGVPTIYDAIEGRDEMPEGSFRDPVPVGRVIEDLELHSISLVSEEPNPAYGVYPVEMVKPVEELEAAGLEPIFHTRMCMQSGQACDGAKGCYRIKDGQQVSLMLPADPDPDRTKDLTGEPIETSNGWLVTPHSEDPDDIAAAEFMAEMVEEGGEEFTREVMDDVMQAMMTGQPLASWSATQHVELADGTKLPIGWSAPKSEEDRERRLEIVPRHTRTEYSDEAGRTGPDFCEECSAEAQDWVAWPCPYMESRMPEHHMPETPLAVTLTRSRLEAQRGPSDFDKDLTDSEWHKVRANSVSATLAAKLGSAADINYLIAREVRERLAGSRFWGNAYTRWGREREVFLEQAALERHGIEPESCLFHARANHRHVASPDGVAVHPENGDICLGEYKTSGKELTWKKMVANGYYDQVQWQLHVLEATHCWLMWEWRHGEKADYSTYVPEVGGEHLILRDEERIAELVRRADLFLEALDAERARLDSAGEDEPDPQLVWLVTELINAKAAVAEADEALREYCELADVKSLEIPGVAKVSYSFGSPRTTFNTSTFKEHHPELYEAYLEEGAPPERATLRVTPVKGEDGP